MASPAALVFSGGIALGAYQAGAYARLYQQDELTTTWYAGSSTGAINAAIILGSAPEQRVENLRRFWSANLPQLPTWPWPHGRHWLTAIQARVFGVHGQFRLRIPSASGRFSSMYDLSPMWDRLNKLVDFGRLNAAEETFCVAATDLHSGETVLFDSRKERIKMEHLMASCGFIPEFEPVQIGERLLGDGGLSANAPVEAVLFETVQTVFVLDLFARDGVYSPDLETALARKNDLIYGNQTLRALEILTRERTGAEGAHNQAIYYLSYRPSQREAGPSRSYDFSSDSIDARWQAGDKDMSKAIGLLAEGAAGPSLHIVR